MPKVSREIILWACSLIFASIYFYDKGAADTGFLSVYNPFMAKESTINRFMKEVKDDDQEQIAIIILTKSGIHSHSVLDPKYEILVAIREKESKKIVYGNIRD